jgi:glycine cleavage system H lipoate-binding protein
MPGNLELIKSPVGEQGWIAKIKISDASQLAGMMDEKAYADYLKGL